MTGEDLDFVARAIKAGLIRSPCLELGVGYENYAFTSKSLVEAAGIKYVGTDMVPGPAVDHVVDFEADWDRIVELLPGAGTFRSALILNVLEHTFDPIRVLDNVMRSLGAGGTCLLVTPAIWPLHDFPYDCCRLMPNFFEQYCLRRGHSLRPEFFEYVGKELIRASGEPYVFPAPGWTSRHQTYSRLVHRLFNTTGRGMRFPSFVAVGAAIVKSSVDSA